MHQIPVKVPFAELSTTLFQIVMAYAAENQIDGDFSNYTARDFVGIFATNNVPVTLAQATAIRKAFDSVGLMEDGKIRSWAKFNRHFAQHEQIIKAKRRAGKLSRQKWERQMAEQISAGKNGHTEHEKTAPKPVQNQSQKESPSKRLFLLNQALENTPRGPARRNLLAQKQELLAASTGVDLTPPPSSPAPPPPEKPRKVTAADRDREALVIAQSMLKDYPDGLNQSMVRVLVSAGIELPAEVQARFSRLFKNPVPE